MNDIGWIAGTLGIVVLDHISMRVRMNKRRARAIASHKLGNKYATDACLQGHHNECYRGCRECGTPCQCSCHVPRTR